ncbi:MAG: hypothetical protein U9N46_12830, partial [Euryarchaeota archaeon]|nr:hypothetical protein [Euryarchaeota archaeon]
MGMTDIQFWQCPTTLVHKRIIIIIYTRVRYVGISHSIAYHVMFIGASAIISASVVRPVVSFKKNWVMPVIACGIAIVSIGTIIY